MTSSVKKPSKFKCKYCGKKFSKLTFLEGHIKDYHIPMTTSLRSGQEQTWIEGMIVKKKGKEM